MNMDIDKEIRLKKMKQEWYLKNKDRIRSKNIIYNNDRNKEVKKIWYNKTKERVICSKCFACIFNKGMKKHSITKKCIKNANLLYTIKINIARYKIFNYIKRYYKRILTILIIKQL